MAKVRGSNGLNFTGTFDVDEILRNQRKVIQGFNDMKKAAEQAMGGSSTNSNALRQAQLQTQQALRESRLEFQRLKNEIQALGNAYRQGKIDEQNYRTELARLRVEKEMLAAATRRARAEQKAATGSYYEAQQRLKQLERQIKGVAGGFNATGRIQQARIKEYKELNERLKQFDATLGNHQRNVGNYKSAFAGVGAQLQGMIAGFVSAQAVLNGINAVFQQTLKSDSIRTSLEFTFESADLADAKLEQLLETANRLGVDYNALTSSYKTFTGAVIASNFDFQQGERIFNAVSAAASRLKLSSQDTEGALRALQQMISKGNVQAEELRGQLGERIPGAFSIAARAMGKTEAQLNKMLEQGQVLASDLLPKLAVEFEKTFQTDNTERVEGLSAAWERLGNVFSGTVAESGRISKFFTVIVDGIGRAAKAIVDMVNSSSWQEFWARLLVNDDQKTGDTIRSITDAVEKAANVLNKTDSLDLATAAPKKIVTSYEEVKLAYEKAAKALKLYQAGIKDGSLENAGKTRVEELANTVNYLYSRMVQIGKFLPEQKVVESDAERKKREAEEKRLAKLAEERLKRAIDLGRKISDNRNESLRNTLEADERELQSVKDKYKKMKEEVDAFYNDPKNKGQNVIINGKAFTKTQVLGGLKADEKRDTDVLLAQREIEALKESTERQKIIFKEFEEYKLDVGTKLANERFSDEVKSFKTFSDYLKSLLPDPNDRSILANKTRDLINKTLLPTAEKDEIKTQQARYTKLLEETQSYLDKRNNLIAIGEENVKILQDKKKFDDAERLRLNNELALKEFDEGYKEQIPALKKLYDGIDELSDKSARNVIDNADKALENLYTNNNISKEVYDQIKKFISQSNEAVDRRLPERLGELAGQINNIADGVGAIDKNFGELLSTLGNVLGQVANIKKGIIDFKAASKEGGGGILGQLTAGAGIASAGFSIFNGLFSLFDKSAQREAQAAYAAEMQAKQFDAINKSLERQISLLDQVYGTDRIREYSAAIEKARANELLFAQQLTGKIQLTGNKEIDDLIRRSNNGETKFGPGNNELVKQLKNTPALQLPTEIEKLRELMESGKLDETTSKIVQNLIDANQAAIDLQNNLNAERVGTSLDQLANDFISTLTDGTKDFGKTFEDTIRNSILQGFKGELIRTQLQNFYTEFARLSEGGLTSDEIDTLRDLYTTAVDKAKKDLKDLEKATGINLGENGSSPSESSMSNSIRANLTEETGSILAGAFNGMKLSLFNIDGNLKILLEANKSIFTSSQANLNVLNQIQANTFRTANNTDSLPQRLEAVEDRLGMIAKNTSDSLGYSLRAAGKFGY